MHGTAISEGSDSGLRLRTAAEVAELFQAKRSWIEEKARRREIPYTMIGGSYRFSQRHIEEIIQIFEERPGDQQRQPGPAANSSKITEPTGVVPLQARRPKRRPRGAST